MSGAYHSVTCWALDCDGIWCDCWCHDDDVDTDASTKNLYQTQYQNDQKEG